MSRICGGKTGRERILESLIDVWCLIKMELITWSWDYELASFSCWLEAFLNINTEQKRAQLIRSGNFSRLVCYRLHASLIAWTFQLYGFLFMGKNNTQMCSSRSFNATVNGYKRDNVKVKSKIGEIKNTKTNESLNITGKNLAMVFFPGNLVVSKGKAN